MEAVILEPGAKSAADYILRPTGAADGCRLHALATSRLVCKEGVDHALATNYRCAVERNSG
jgi:hypothetical protein